MFFLTHIHRLIYHLHTIEPNASLHLYCMCWHWMDNLAKEVKAEVVVTQSWNLHSGQSSQVKRLVLSRLINKSVCFFSDNSHHLYHFTKLSQQEFLKESGIDLNAIKRAFAVLFINYSVSIFRTKKKKSQGWDSSSSRLCIN